MAGIDDRIEESKNWFERMMTPEYGSMMPGRPIPTPRSEWPFASMNSRARAKNERMRSARLSLVATSSVTPENEWITSPDTVVMTTTYRTFWISMPTTTPIFSLITSMNVLKASNGRIPPPLREFLFGSPRSRPRGRRR